MAWLSATQLFVAQPESGEREIVTLTLSQGSFDDQILLPLTRYVYPLALRRISTGIVGASVESDGFLYFWSAASPAASGAIYTPFAYVSGKQAFVAETDESFGDAFLYPMGESLEALDILPECAVVLAWADGPAAGSLAGSRVACLRVQEGAATVTVYAFDAALARTALTLDDPTLRAALATEANWVGHARGFSPDGQWLALATTEHDLLVDLRAPAPKYYAAAAGSPGSTARGFSRSGSYLLQQRGLTLDFVVLVPGDDQAPIPLRQLDADKEPGACAIAQHAASWCGAPEAAAAASARWASREDVAVFLTRDGGLSLLSRTAAGDGLRRVPVSTCGASCVTQYELGP
jgi:hypothetical protein